MNSRIVVIDARNDQVQVIYSGSSEHPFYTDIMGKHQWLPNGNILVTESKRGRAFEIDANGKLLWEYFNLVDKGRLALVTEAERLPSFFTPSFFMEGRRTCDKVPVAEVSAPKELSHLELEPDDSQKSPLQRKYLLRR
jgi:arylsulfotransferase ASST